MNALLGIVSFGKRWNLAGVNCMLVKLLRNDILLIASKFSMLLQIGKWIFYLCVLGNLH